jgi:hypothetical protein
MTAGRHGGPGRAPADVRLRAAAPGYGRPRVGDRRRILVCDAESQSLHALRVVLRSAWFEVDMTAARRRRLTARLRARPRPRS